MRLENSHRHHHHQILFQNLTDVYSAGGEWIKWPDEVTNVSKKIFNVQVKRGCF